jgi:hypothetical protein
MSAANLKQFTFSVTLLTTIHVNAASREEAERTVEDCVGGASANLGAWPNGDPIVCEVGTEGALDLEYIDGEPAD